MRASHGLAVIFTRSRGAVPLSDIPYIDHPELSIGEHESTEMPFRYVRNSDGSPFMPKVGS